MFYISLSYNTILQLLIISRSKRNIFLGYFPQRSDPLLAHQALTFRECCDERFRGVHIPSPIFLWLKLHQNVLHGFYLLSHTLLTCLFSKTSHFRLLITIFFLIKYGLYLLLLGLPRTWALQSLPFQPISPANRN